MPGLGTLINIAAIVAGGLVGIAFGNVFSERLRDSLIALCGIITLFIGAGGTLSKMLILENGTFSTTGTMMMMSSLLIGTVIGEILNLEGKIEQFGNWLKAKTGNEKDAAFTNAFVTASLTVCIGAMAIVGSIQDGIYANHSILFAKSVLDFVIIIAMTASLGKGAVFSAVSVGILQGTITLLAKVLSPLLTDAALTNLSYTGSVMIFCVGINLLFPRKIRVANLLPGLLIAVLWAFLPFSSL